MLHARVHVFAVFILYGGVVSLQGCSGAAVPGLPLPAVPEFPLPAEPVPPPPPEPHDASHNGTNPTASNEKIEILFLRFAMVACLHG